MEARTGNPGRDDNGGTDSSIGNSLAAKRSLATAVARGSETAGPENFARQIKKSQALRIRAQWGF